MTSGMGGYAPPSTQAGTGAATQDQSTIDAAKEHAAEIGHAVQETGGQVAATVAGEARAVAGETARQAKDLIGEAQTQLKDQAAAQKEKAAGGLHSLADELRSLAEGTGPHQGVAADLAKQAADKAHHIATWLEQRDAGGILDEVRDLARRRPGVFLLGTALAGVAAGRLTRGAMAAGADTGSRPAASAPPVPAVPAVPADPTGNGHHPPLVPPSYPRLASPEATAPSWDGGR